MISYETHFKSKRPDGRHVASLAAHMERIRQMKPKLALPEELTPEMFGEWQKQVKAKVRDLILLPEFTQQPDPVMLSRAKRDGYVLEKWEFYPDDFTVVPVLILIPDCATAENPAPGVFCLPGNTHSKELLAGEPLLDQLTCRCLSHPDRNKMAYHLVKNGMVAFAFDNPATAECALDVNLEHDFGEEGRSYMCSGYLFSGYCYPGMSAFQKLCFLKFVKTLPYVDQNRLAVSAHSLGTMPAVLMGLLCDDFKAVI